MAEKDNQQFLRCKFLSRRTSAGLAFRNAIKGTMLLVLLLTPFSVFAQRQATVQAVTKVSVQSKSASEESIDCGSAKWADVEHQYVYFGTYPQTEIKGDMLTDDIINANYDKSKTATVDGVKYLRLSFSDVEFKEEARYRWTYDMELEKSLTGDEYHYFKYEPIKWRILSNKDGKVFLFAEQALAPCPYGNSADWESSTMRSWLNSTFYNSAFTPDEQKAICDTELKKSINPDSKLTSGNPTKDKVFILSYEEMTNEEYGFPPRLSGFNYDNDVRIFNAVALITNYGHLTGAMDCFNARAFIKANVLYHHHYLGNYAIRTAAD